MHGNKSESDFTAFLYATVELDRFIYRMLWFRPRLKIAAVVSLLVVLYQRKEVECQTTGKSSN